MKKILTHILAFILGVVSLPFIIGAFIHIAPETFNNIVSYVISGKCAPDRGIVALEKSETEEDRFYALGDAAKEAFNKENYIEAQSYAEELEKMTPNYKSNWNYGNAIQDYNIVLGRLALKNGEIEKAKQHLLAAGKSPGSPQMDTFGPNMTLAKDLLGHGEQEVVIEYFELCKSFWEMHRGKLDEWTVLAKSGRIPEFGANLDY